MAGMVLPISIGPDDEPVALTTREEAEAWLGPLTDERWWELFPEASSSDQPAPPQEAVMPCPTCGGTNWDKRYNPLFCGIADYYCCGQRRLKTRAEVEEQVRDDMWPPARGPLSEEEMVDVILADQDESIDAARWAEFNRKFNDLLMRGEG